jgi:hypothetical protein
MSRSDRQSEGWVSSGLPELVRQEFQAVVRWTLTREENAAITIQKLSYRISQESELAEKSRSYAAALRFYIARIKAHLPPDRRWVDDASTHDILTDQVVLSLDAEKARSVLIRFLLQHAETASESMLFAAEKLNFAAVYRLWRKADSERASIVQWLEEQENAEKDRQQKSQLDREQSSGLNREGVTSEEPARNQQFGNFSAYDGRRISHNPRQVVIWM